jgi:hypothetical protein
VLARLAAALKARLELAFTGGDDEHGNVGLRGARDHARHERLVARRVEDGVAARGRLKVGAADLDGLALCALLRCRVEGPGQVPALAAGLLGLALVLFHRALVDHTGQEEQVAAHGGLAGVDVADEDDVEVLLDCGAGG